MYIAVYARICMYMHVYDLREPYNAQFYLHIRTTRCLAGRWDGSAPSVLPPRGTWATGPHNCCLILSPSPSSSPTNPITHHAHTHVYWPPPAWRPSSALSWYLPTSSDIVDQALQP